MYSNQIFFYTRGTRAQVKVNRRISKEKKLRSYESGKDPSVDEEDQQVKPAVRTYRAGSNLNTSCLGLGAYLVN
jgi:hypothetical protein